jgi:tetratricopeptide (TPR) repeat protein
MNRVGLGILLLAAMGMAAPDVAFDWNTRGLEASDRHNYAEAEALFEKASQRWIALGPGFEAHLATTRLNQAQAVCAQGRRTDCARLFEESVALFRKSRGVADERTLTAMNLLGGIYSMLGQYDRGEALFQEALEAERRFLPGDVQMARSLGGLAAMRTHDGRLEEALPLAEEALAVVLRTEGEESVDAAMAYANVAEIHREARRAERALPLYRKSRALYEKLLGPRHPRVASILSQEGLILLAEGKLSLAGDYMQKSLRILRDSCPNCAFEMWVAETNLGLLRMRQAKYNEADMLFSHVLELQEKSLERPGPEVAATLQLLASARRKQHRFEDADRLKRRADVLLSYR